MQNENSKVRVTYEQTSALFSSQFVVNAGTDELVIDFSSGAVPRGDETVLPIHSRIALTMDAATRLVSVLNQALQTRTNSMACFPTSEECA